VLGTPQAISIAVGALLVSLISYRTMYWLIAAVIAVAAMYLMWALGRQDLAARAGAEDDEEGVAELAPTDQPGGVVTPVAVTVPPTDPAGSDRTGQAERGPSGEIDEEPSQIQPGGLDRERNQ
jgi:hypothetical protein